VASFDRSLRTPLHLIQLWSHFRQLKKHPFETTKSHIEVAITVETASLGSSWLRGSQTRRSISPRSLAQDSPLVYLLLSVRRGPLPPRDAPDPFHTLPTATLGGTICLLNMMLKTQRSDLLKILYSRLHQPSQTQVIRKSARCLSQRCILPSPPQFPIAIPSVHGPFPLRSLRIRL
jgi:hypothetical protein